MWQKATPQVRVCMAGGRQTGGQSQEDNETEARATVETVLVAYQQNHGQMGQLLEELHELHQLQSSMDTRLGQISEYMGQLVVVLRDMHAAQIAAHNPLGSRMLVTTPQQRLTTWQTGCQLCLCFCATSLVSCLHASSRLP